MPLKKWTLWALWLAIMAAACTGTQHTAEAPPIDESRPFLQFELTYNYDVYEKPAFFLPKSQPTFAIWLEDQSSGDVQTIYVTGKAAEGKWIMADSRPESVPVWYGVRQKENIEQRDRIDAVTGATPAGDTAVIRWQVPDRIRNRQVSIFIEANSSFDHNDYYSDQKGAAGYSGENGQPSLVWKADLDLSKSGDEEIVPEIIGHGSLLGTDHKIYADISRVTTARDTFSYIGIRYFGGR